MANLIDREALVGELNAKFGNIAEVVEDSFNMIIKVNPEKLVEVMQELKTNPKYELVQLMNLNGVDYPENFTVVYHLSSLTYHNQLTVKVELSKEKPEVPSITSCWYAANVNERETYDLLGIVFTGHPNLKRILMPDDYVGHPLRKDFKLQA